MVAWVAVVVCSSGAALFMMRLRNVRRIADPAAADRAAAACVSVIVPARDEAQNLPTLLASLSALDPAPLEVIVVDDHSSDDTAAIAAAAGARVIEPESRPPAFIGKPWACLAGALAARGRYLLFTDADTWHAPGSLAVALDALSCARTGLVSIVPTHRVTCLWEKLQGVFQLLLLIAARADSGRLPRARPFAIGQYLLFRREAYDAIDGHAATPHRIAEDLALARLVSRAGYIARPLFAPGALRVRMYPEGFRAFFAGWRRNFRDGLSAGGARSVVELTLIIGWLLSGPVWLTVALMRGDWSWVAVWAVMYATSALLVAREQRHYGDFPRWSALLYPLFVIVFVTVTLTSLSDAIRRKPVSWRGRTFDLVR